MSAPREEGIALKQTGHRLLFRNLAGSRFGFQFAIRNPQSAISPGRKVPPRRAASVRPETPGEAPPPVEMWLIWSATPACWTAADRVAAADDAHGAGVGHRLRPRPRCRRRTAPSRTRPWGRSRRWFWPRRSRRRRPAGSRADVQRPSSRRGSPRPARRCAPAPSASSLSATTWSAGRSRTLPAAAACCSSSRGQLDLVLLDQRVADGLPLGLQEGVGHGAADEQRVHLGSRFSITSILSETLAPPRMATNGRSGLPSARPR